MARETSERELVSAMWRLVEQAERKGVRIVTEWASREHFATSTTDPTRIYRVTGFSCCCPGFVQWQRCMHNSLLLAELGWLPELDPDPEPAGPSALAVVPEPVDAPCLDCRGSGTVMRLGSMGGALFELNCDTCGGSGRHPVSPEVVETVTDAGRVGSAGAPNASDPVAGMAGTGVSEPVDVIEAVANVSPRDGTTCPFGPPDPWDDVPTESTPTPDIVPAPSVAVTGEREVETAVGPATSPAPIPFARREQRADAMEATIEEAVTELADQLARGHTREYLQVLEFFSRFHRYSFHNTLLIKA